MKPKVIQRISYWKQVLLLHENKPTIVFNEKKSQK